ncbi:hydroxyethylthiazole kinase [Furfurilactobacillus siliginis]|nr:hydroxyethylthiazole kinase [Furfurilactobacillus siliginis]GEK27750.1 hydroxyethylthiazole kinase [Furfurilactobacillus siliginis]
MGVTQYQPGLLNQIRNLNPVVVTIANNVTIGDVANAVNAIGASPVMPAGIAESAEMVAIASAVTINLGTWTNDQFEQMLAVNEAAIAAKRPVLIDPVAVALPTRRRLFDRLIATGTPTVIRANAGEIAALAGQSGTSKGIDAGTVTDTASIAAAVAKRFHTIVVMTGPTDYVSDGTQTIAVTGGTSLFAAHVGSGDMLSSVLAAYLAVTDDFFTAAVTGTAQFGAIGQWVADDQQLTNQQPGTFAVKLMDGFATATNNDLNSLVKVEAITK